MVTRYASRLFGKEINHHPRFMATSLCLWGSAGDHPMAALQQLPLGEFEAKVLQQDDLPVANLL